MLQNQKFPSVIKQLVQNNFVAAYSQILVAAHSNIWLYAYITKMYIQLISVVCVYIFKICKVSLFAFYFCMASWKHSLLQNGCSFFTKNLPPSNDLEHWKQQKQLGDTCQLNSFHPTRWSPAAIFSLQVWHFWNKYTLSTQCTNVQIDKK